MGWGILSDLRSGGGGETEGGLEGVKLITCIVRTERTQPPSHS